jgi:CheY-like chemotaxis protein
MPPDAPILHDGSVRANGDGPARGAEFAVPLPASEPEAPTAPAREPENAKPPGQRMLIVDDNRDAADSLGMLMKVMGNDTRVAYDGREALATASQFHPEVVLLDIGLPTVSGYEVARELRRRPGGATLLLIATTGWGQPSDKEQSREAGFDHHLVKPVDPAALLKLLDRPGRPGHAAPR